MRLTVIAATLASLSLNGAYAHAKAISAGEVLPVQEESQKTGNAAFPPAPDEAKLRAEVPLGKAAIIGDKGYFLSEGHLYWTRLGSGASNVVSVRCTFLYDLYAQAADVRFKQIVAFREALFLLEDSGTVTRLRLSDENKVLAAFQDGREANVYDVLEI